ncbi:MAG: heme-binding protein [Elusimicrobia bacterium]|nr:heme-binding protein [Elusimicrobiota bacterium]
MTGFNKSKLGSAAWICLFLFLPFFLTEAALGIEQPKFSVVKTDGDFELRQMESFAVAETEVRATFKEAGNSAFRKLFRYIQGQNQGQKKIPMTAPVGQQSQGSPEKISMTAPVTQVLSENGYIVSFTLPSIYTAETAPQPNDETVVLRQVPSRKVAVITYSGSWSESRYEEKKSALIQWIAAQGLTSKNEPILARYNAPFTLWFLRHNEVQIEVD